jgi:hypothetical protein
VPGVCPTDNAFSIIADGILEVLGCVVQACPALPSGLGGSGIPGVASGISGWAEEACSFFDPGAPSVDLRSVLFSSFISL